MARRGDKSNLWLSKEKRKTLCCMHHKHSKCSIPQPPSCLLGREGGREGGRERGREGGRKGEGGREGGRERKGREGEKGEGGREGEKGEGGREGEGGCLQGFSIEGQESTVMILRSCFK